MIITRSQFKDTKAVAEAWINHQCYLDELDLHDYERPLKVMKEVGPGPFEKMVARYGFAGACLRYIAP